MSARRWAFVTASSLGPSCLASRDAAGCNTRFYTPHPARTLPTRVAAAFRTAHLHSGPIARTKFRRAFNAPIIARGLFSTFSDPPKSGWGLPPPGSAVLQLVPGLAGQEGGGREEGGRRGGGEGPFLPALDGCGLRRTAIDTCSCVEWEQRFHSHSALCRTPARATARARADGGAMGATACAFSLL